MIKKKGEVKTEEELEMPILEWGKVERYSAGGDFPSLFFALVEADKILNSYLKKQGYPGGNTEERIEKAKERFSDIKGLLKALNIKKTILEKENPKITTLDLQEALSSYKQALLDLTVEEKPLSFLEKIILYIDFYFPHKIQTLKKTGVAVFLFLFCVYFFSSTALGKTIWGAFIGFSRFLFSWIFALLILVVGVVVLFVVTIFYFEYKKRSSR